MLMNRVCKSYLCKICNKATGIKACKCQKVYYCSRNCQKIDWDSHKTYCCYRLVNYSAIAKQSTITQQQNNTHETIAENNSTVQNNFTNNNDVLFLLQSNEMDMTHMNNSPIHMHIDKEQNFTALEREGRNYDPTPLQYQQQPHAITYTNEANTSTFSTPPSNYSNTTLDDDDFFLFNSLMCSVDESTEQEILKNLNIRAEDLLATYSLDNDISPSFNDQQLADYVPNTQESNEQLLSDKILDQIQRQESFEYKPETRQLLRETKENLEKELSLLRENQLHELQESFDSGNLDTMQLGSSNQKYVSQEASADYILMRTPDEQMALDEMCFHLIRDLNKYGVCVMDNFLGVDKGRKVLDEVKAMYSAGLFKDGQVVASKSKLDHRHIRSDKITWIDGKEQGLINTKFLINQVDTVITLANRMTNNGKLGQHNIRERTKAMVACYEGKGSHYVKHIDNPNRDGRCITCIYYLNLDWDVQQDGGLLRIFPEGWEDRVADIEPLFDRITFFWSDRRNPHEVQPSLRTRYAITLWYFDAHEREEAVRKYRKNRENLLKAA